MKGRKFVFFVLMIGVALLVVGGCFNNNNEEGINLDVNVIFNCDQDALVAAAAAAFGIDIPNPCTIITPDGGIGGGGGGGGDTGTGGGAGDGGGGQPPCAANCRQVCLPGEAPISGTCLNVGEICCAGGGQTAPPIPPRGYISIDLDFSSLRNSLNPIKRQFASKNICATLSDKNSGDFWLNDNPNTLGSLLDCKSVEDYKAELSAVNVDFKKINMLQETSDESTFRIDVDDFIAFRNVVAREDFMNSIHSGSQNLRVFMPTNKIRSFSSGGVINSPYEVLFGGFGAGSISIVSEKGSGSARLSPSTVTSMSWLFLIILGAIIVIVLVVFVLNKRKSVKK